MAFPSSRSKSLAAAAMGFSSLASVACVTKGAYQELEAKHKETDAALAAARKENSTLQAKVRGVEGTLSDTRKEKGALEGDVATMRRAMQELEKRRAEADARIAEYRDLLARFKTLIDAGKLRVKVVAGRMVVELATDVLFPSGSARLSKEGTAAVAEVSTLLAAIPDKKYQVEGHTDDVPIKSARYASNWELAADRAITVVREMATAGLAEGRVSAASFASTAPVKPNDTPEGRAANRRIEIVVVPDLSSLPGFDELGAVDSGSAAPDAKAVP